MVPGHELIALHRSAGMLRDGQTIPLPRATILALCEEMLANRQIIERSAPICARSRSVPAN